MSALSGVLHGFDNVNLLSFLCAQPIHRHVERGYSLNSRPLWLTRWKGCGTLWYVPDIRSVCLPGSRIILFLYFDLPWTKWVLSLNVDEFGIHMAIRLPAGCFAWQPSSLQHQLPMECRQKSRGANSHGGFCLRRYTVGLILREQGLW